MARRNSTRVTTSCGRSSNATSSCIGWPASFCLIPCLRSSPDRGWQTRLSASRWTRLPSPALEPSALHYRLSLETVMPTREEAWSLLCEFTQSESLRKHMLAVEACVRAYARKNGSDEETWGLAA